MDALASLLGSSSPKHPYSPAGLALQGYAPIGRSLASVLVPFSGWPARSPRARGRGQVRTGGQ